MGLHKNSREVCALPVALSYPSATQRTKKRPRRAAESIPFSILRTNGDDDDADDAQEKAPPKAAFHTSVTCDSFCDCSTNQTNNQITDQISHFVHSLFMVFSHCQLHPADAGFLKAVPEDRHILFVIHQVELCSALVVSPACFFFAEQFPHKQQSKAL